MDYVGRHVRVTLDDTFIYADQLCVSVTRKGQKPDIC